jgi:hypothetical protein
LLERLGQFRNMSILFRYFRLQKLNHSVAFWVWIGIISEKVGNAWRIPSAQFRDDSDPNPESHAMIEFLKSEIAEKNRHIAELTKALQQQQTLLLIAEDKQRSWWSRLLTSIKRQDHTIVT